MPSDQPCSRYSRAPGSNEPIVPAGSPVAPTPNPYHGIQNTNLVNDNAGMRTRLNMATGTSEYSAYRWKCWAGSVGSVDRARRQATHAGNAIEASKRYRYPIRGGVTRSRPRNSEARGAVTRANSTPRLTTQPHSNCRRDLAAAPPVSARSGGPSSTSVIGKHPGHAGPERWIQMLRAVLAGS